MSEQKREPEQPVEGITDELIARHAYEISESPDSGTPEENWERAERELREGRAGSPGMAAP